jgi:hypothetical protein
VRLLDGSVLVLGGTTGSAVPTNAWVFRPSLTGPTSGQVDVGSDGMGSGMMTTVPAVAGGSLSLSAGSTALVGGPHVASGSVDASLVVNPPGGTIKLIAQWQGPGRMLVGTLSAGQAATLARQDGMATVVSCTGQQVPMFQGSGTEIELSVANQSATLSIAGRPYVTCSLANDRDVGDVGQWGLATGEGTSASVVTVAVSR